MATLLLQSWWELTYHKYSGKASEEELSKVQRFIKWGSVYSLDSEQPRTQFFGNLEIAVFKLSFSESQIHSFKEMFRCRWGQAWGSERAPPLIQLVSREELNAMAGGN
jgi:hypothetical protein